MADGGKDRWDKLGVFLHPMGGLLTALAVAVVGMRGSQVLDRRQSVDTNARLYSELMSRREEADSGLRKDMFVSIISQYLRPSDNDLDAKVLNLELLACNFNDALDLRPLFFDLQRRINKMKDWNERRQLLNRIETVAKETTAKQLFSLEGHGRSFRRTVDFEELAKADGGMPLDGEAITVGGVKCQVNLRALSIDKDQETVTLRLVVKAPPDRPDLTDTNAKFEASYFDFPMIDNTRLSNGLRCAVTLANFNDFAAELVTVCFPGEYGSMKDRPYYDEVILKLHETTDNDGSGSGSTAAPPPDNAQGNPK
ncbi:MAG TPA: hypothetical protein VFV19_12335 [Candidatus Polarisedimenticolaceae bacterium]|nr:hypothetical protein [Candidatus Polarisedimenticolaceae bacterium]